MQDKVLCNVREAGERLSLGRTKILQLIQARELPTVRIGRAVRIPTAALESFVARRLRDEADEVDGVRERLARDGGEG